MKVNYYVNEITYDEIRIILQVKKRRRQTRRYYIFWIVQHLCIATVNKINRYTDMMIFPFITHQRSSFITQ